MADHSRGAAAHRRRIDINEALGRLGASRFAKMLQHGDLEVELYAPDGIDHQQPHPRDELYFVARGSGTFVNGDLRHPFKAGDLLFVPAHVEHRFEDFTEDFATWVVFWGPDGGYHGHS